MTVEELVLAQCGLQSKCLPGSWGWAVATSPEACWGGGGLKVGRMCRGTRSGSLGGPGGSGVTNMLCCVALGTFLALSEPQPHPLSFFFKDLLFVY